MYKIHVYHRSAQYECLRYLHSTNSLTKVECMGSLAGIFAVLSLDIVTDKYCDVLCKQEYCISRFLHCYVYHCKQKLRNDTSCCRTSTRYTFDVRVLHRLVDVAHHVFHTNFRIAFTYISVNNKIFFIKIVFRMAPYVHHCEQYSTNDVSGRRTTRA